MIVTRCSLIISTSLSLRGASATQQSRGGQLSHQTLPPVTTHASLLTVCPDDGAGCRRYARSFLRIPNDTFGVFTLFDRVDGRTQYLAEHQYAFIRRNVMLESVVGDFALAFLGFLVVRVALAVFVARVRSASWGKFSLGRSVGFHPPPPASSEC